MGLEEMHPDVAKLRQEAAAYQNGPVITNEMQLRIADEWAVHEGADIQKGILDWIDTYGKRFRDLVDAEPGILAEYSSGSEEKKKEILASLKERLYH